MTLLSPDGIRIERRSLDRPVALFSVDVETDYGTGRTEALSRLDRFVDLMRVLDVPWTAFVEGQFFENRRETCALLRDAGVDIQVHCYDHTQPGDTPESLRRSAGVASDFLGRPVEGYRAHTYRLTRPLYDTLLDAGFRWDSSLMRAFAQGGNRHPGFQGGDYLVFDDRLVEFPIGTWRGLPVALNHTHLLLAKTPGEMLLCAALGPTSLVNYNFHMTDLVRCDSLGVARRSPHVRALHRYLWSLHGGDTFAVVRRFVQYLRRLDYQFRSTSALYREVRPITLRDESVAVRP